MTLDASNQDRRLDVMDALRVLSEARDEDQVVVTNQMSARLWPQVSSHRLDFNYNPSTMGGAVPLGLGIALARPAREVVVLSGDGALLMSLGSLVSVIDSRVKNLTIVVLNNDIYEVTGGQQIPGSSARLDYAAVARAVGFPTAQTFDELEAWTEGASQLFHQPGPRLIALRVHRYSGPLLESGGEDDIAVRAQRLHDALHGAVSGSNPSG